MLDLCLDSPTTLGIQYGCPRCAHALNSHRVAAHVWHIYSSRSMRFYMVRLADGVRPVDRCDCAKGQHTAVWKSVECRHVTRAKEREAWKPRPVVVDGNGVELFGNDDDGDPGDAQPGPRPAPQPKPEPPKKRAMLEDLFHLA
jgi:hypothetical protein